MRQATFNALESLGALRGAGVLDLFAGSGAMGIEALSRGAAHATFVDHDPRSLAAIRTNLTATGLASSARVVRSDALGFLAQDGSGADLVVLDPPYRFDDAAWERLLAAVTAPLAVVESDRAIEVGPRWEVLRAKRYGATLVAIVRSR